jgi:hypothetical protein
MLNQDVNQVFHGLLAKKDLALPVNDIFLQIYRNRFRGTEVFHRIGNLYPQFFTNPEKMIDCRPAVENYRCVLEDIDPAGAEIFRRNPFNADELKKIQNNLVFVSYLEIGRFFSGRLRLGDKYSLNLQVFMTLVDIEKFVLTILPLWTEWPTTMEEFQGYKGIKTYKILIYGMISKVPVPVKSYK